MLKTLLLTIALFLTLSPLAKADDGATITGIISQIKFDAGFAWNINDKRFEQTNTIELLNYKGLALNTGYGTSDTLLVGLSYDNLPKLADLGIAIPILKQITFQPTIMYGWSRINGADLNSGKSAILIGAKLISIKF